MRKIKESFVKSVEELKSTRTMAVAAMLLAIAVILGFFSIQITENIKISFAFLVDQVTGMLFGPFVGAVVGGASDILKYFIRPTGPYFPGFTISEIVTGLIYGFMYYRKPFRVGRVIAANVIVTLTVNILLNTYWLSLLYGNPYLVILPLRIVKELIVLPVNIILFCLLSQLLRKAGIMKKLRPVKAGAVNNH